MFKKPKKTDEPIVDIQAGGIDSTLDDGFSEDVKYSAAPQKKKKQAALSKKQRTVITVISCVLVVLLLFAGSVFLFPAFYFSNSTALTVNGMKVPVSEYNFNYWTTIQIFNQSYGEIFSADVLDMTKDLSKQPCPSTIVGDQKMSWQDYFLEETDTRIQSTIISYQNALELELNLTESNQRSIDIFLNETIPQYAADNNITDDEFIKYMFGSSCTKENLRTALEHIYIAERYNDHLFESYQVEQKELDDWMTEYKDQFWGALYHFYAFKAESTDEISIKAAKQKAHEFLSGVNDRASFAALAYETAQDDEKESFQSASATLRYYFTADEVSDPDVSTWLFDEARQPGDKEVIYSVPDGTAYALYFVDADFPPTKASNLFSIYLGIGGKYADQSAAQAAAQSVQAKFIEGGKTAEVFSALAEEYSDDPEAGEDGGLIENFLPKNMDQEVAIWCYTTNRAEGEYTIIESSYGGYYFVWLGSWGDPVWQVTAIDDIKNYRYMLAQNEVLTDIKSKPTFFRAFMVDK